MLWKLVPVDPTHEMTGAILKPMEDRGDLLAIWELMLKGAPSAVDDPELVDRMARAMAKVIAKRHGAGHRIEDWMSDERLEEARAAILALEES